MSYKMCIYLLFVDVLVSLKGYELKRELSVDVQTILIPDQYTRSKC